MALLVPDAVIRVFVLHFDEFPRKAEEAIPMLRWRLKKSVPFEAEETLISYMRQLRATKAWILSPDLRDCASSGSTNR